MKQRERAQRDWPQRRIDSEPEYHTGAELHGAWAVAPSVEPRREAPIHGGPVLRTWQMDTMIPNEALTR